MKTQRDLYNQARPGTPEYAKALAARNQAVKDLINSRKITNNFIVKPLAQVRKAVNPRVQDIQKGLERAGKGAASSKPVVPLKPNTSSGGPVKPGPASKFLKGLGKVGKGLGIAGTALSLYDNVKNDGVAKGLTKTAGGVAGAWGAGAAVTAGCTAIGVATAGVGGLVCAGVAFGAAYLGGKYGSQIAGWGYDRAKDIGNFANENVFKPVGHATEVAVDIGQGLRGRRGRRREEGVGGPEPLRLATHAPVSKEEPEPGPAPGFLAFRGALGRARGRRRRGAARRPRRDRLGGAQGLGRGGRLRPAVHRHDRRRHDALGLVAARGHARRERAARRCCGATSSPASCGRAAATPGATTSWARASPSRSTASTAARCCSRSRRWPARSATRRSPRGRASCASRRAARPTSRTRTPRAAGAVQAALEAVGLTAEAPRRPGVWRIAVDEGVVEAVLRDTGESLLLMRELEYAGGEDDVEALRWLLLASDWGSARMGLASLPGGPGLFSVCAVPAASLEPQALAWGVGEVLQLSDEYDRLAAG